ncbi:MAG: metal-dependent transcriptional regulator [Bifidobacteriaceae bacterium]|jgi:DtxR family Mn-dependent transcriptional regulator|nr:metal-dependent transcriptional regulator [Bifidobacteriaceae bacterium]MCI1914356.1 metal-dependent transcriptional regulator [Bifidobacteriaceae bacterium]
MAFEDLSINSQDYLKVIWDLQEWTGQAVQPKALAKKTGMKLSTVSGAIGRLAASSLVEHTPYGAITLTQEGERYALIMVRRHRLLESFLVKTLGYTWDEVHNEADALEHAVSDKLVERIDATLGRPTHDPHGDPIPDANGTIVEEATLPLSQAAEGSLVTVERVSDEDPDLLRYLTQEGIVVGTQLRIGRKAPYSNSVNATVVHHDARGETPADPAPSVTLGNAAAEYIRILEHTAQ